jgi:hypothetical protein
LFCFKSKNEILVQAVFWFKMSFKSLVVTSETPNGMLPTYNLLDCITTFEPTTGVADAALCWTTGTCIAAYKLSNMKIMIENRWVS